MPSSRSWAERRLDALLVNSQLVMKQTADRHIWVISRLREQAMAFGIGSPNQYSFGQIVTWARYIEGVAKKLPAKGTSAVREPPGRSTQFEDTTS